jgi:hypothetical protein
MPVADREATRRDLAAMDAYFARQASSPDEHAFFVAVYHHLAVEFARWRLWHETDGFRTPRQ